MNVEESETNSESGSEDGAGETLQMTIIKQQEGTEVHSAASDEDDDDDGPEGATVIYNEAKMPLL